MRAAVAPFALAGLALGAWLSGASVSVGARAVSVPDLLDRYARADFEAALQSARQAPGAQVAKGFEESGSRWIQAGDPAAIERRRQAATAFALDVADGFRRQDWGVARRLYQWAFAEWSKVSGAPGPPEHLWYETAIPLLESADDWLLLAGRPMAAGAPTRGLPPTLLGRALDRFPGDPRFRLAAAVIVEGRFVDIDATFRDMGRLAGAGAKPTLDSQMVSEYRRLADSLTELAADPGLAPEAALHLGFVRMRLGQFDDALVRFEAVERGTEEVQLKYVARLLQGFSLERRGRLDDAAAAWRAALAVAPRAQSATTLLTSLLVRLDEPEEAAGLVERFLSGGPPAADPWRQYRLGDAWRLPSQLARLREALR